MRVMIKKIEFNEAINDVQWNKNKDISLIAVVTHGDKVYMLNPGVSPYETAKNADQLLLTYKEHLREITPVEVPEEEEGEGKKKRKNSM